MKLLIVNPNISTSVTELIEAEARRTAGKDTEITMETASFGVEYIETPAEALIGAYATLNILAERHADYDAAIIAAFGDPGLAEAQEIFDIPVVGLSRAAFMTACLAGERFSIVAISNRIVQWYRNCVAANGLSSRLASVRSLPAPKTDVGNIQEKHGKDLLELCDFAVRKDGADSIIVAGAPLAGLATKLRGEISAPLIDGVSSAVSQAELLVFRKVHRHMGFRKANRPSKAQTGLNPALAALMTTSTT
ncbi:MAG: aspartate/glutamate racemase family protein [Rhodospirillales bacterium]|nr:aspartate/glutamate racemase family protein [Rhodospirillales bacterium]